VEKRLVDVAKMCASQINGFDYCLDRHAPEARSRGEQRRYLLSARGEPKA
jgi:AhpD family alkylhydroperoxidase